MALNYSTQFNYTGKGFVDSKMNPFATKDAGINSIGELKIWRPIGLIAQIELCY